MPPVSPPGMPRTYSMPASAKAATMASPTVASWSSSGCAKSAIAVADRGAALVEDGVVFAAAKRGRADAASFGPSVDRRFHDREPIGVHLGDVPGQPVDPARELP